MGRQIREKPSPEFVLGAERSAPVSSCEGVRHFVIPKKSGFTEMKLCAYKIFRAAVRSRELLYAQFQLPLGGVRVDSDQTPPSAEVLVRRSV